MNAILSMATLINIQLTYLHAYKSSSGKNILDVSAKYAFLNTIIVCRKKNENVVLF